MPRVKIASSNGIRGKNSFIFFIGYKCICLRIQRWLFNERSRFSIITDDKLQVHIQILPVLRSIASKVFRGSRLNIYKQNVIKTVYTSVTVNRYLNNFIEEMSWNSCRNVSTCTFNNKILLINVLGGSGI